MSGLILPAGAGAQALTADREAARSRPYWERSNFGPFGATVTVARITATHAKATLQAVKYEVNAQWVGPPMAGTGYPASEVGQRSDSWWTEDGPLAEEVARRACSELRVGRVPDLPKIGEQARRT
jgi:hypothetical protein